MTDTLDRSLPRPAPDVASGPLDTRFYDLVETRFRRLLRDNPVLATALGIHTWDTQLGDGGREVLLAELAADRAHLAEVEALDPGELSPSARVERDLEIHNVRRAIFDTAELRIWERRSQALDTVGDGLFLPFVRHHAPFPERLESITGRLEATADHLAAARHRSDVPPVRLWQQIEIEAAERLPAFIDEVTTSAAPVLARPELDRLGRAAVAAKAAIGEYATWLEGTLASATDDWPCGRERHDELVALRAFDGLDADDILQLGYDKLAEELSARATAAREIDPDATPERVVALVKTDHPATFERALDGYRDAMRRARAYLIEHDLVTIPDDEEISVIETPEYMRNVVPFAAYFSPAPFDPDPEGIYIVTPSVHDDPDAMLEHNRASVSNTSVHEAYPGHHLQLDVARRHPSLTRHLADAPEFVEGWGMYSELMMREHGFDDDPAFRVMLHTDAIWRACRIILDVRLHRGELTLDEATDFMVEQTRFARSNARSEVQWYTYRPTYPLSYLLGRTLLLELRADEQRRLGDRFSLKAFHDTLLRNGSIPISFHRRELLASS